MQIDAAALDDFHLDPRNPRLGLRNAQEELPQEAILERMQTWALEELGESFLESGYWPQEAILVVKEQVYGGEHLVVVEGNRRLAALILLRRAFAGDFASKSWQRLVEDRHVPDGLFEEISYILMGSRQEVDIYLGFRHVTGIKEWAPAEKAEYIAFLIDQVGLTYDEIRRKIGSKTDTVRRNYIAHNVLEQAKADENIDESRVLEKFSVLFLALKASGVQTFLGVDITAEPQGAKTPIPQDHVNNLRDFARWLFGRGDEEPIVRESRQVDRFAKVLQSEEAVQYLRTARRPNLDRAFVIAGGEEAELIELIETAAFDIEQALSTIHLYTDSRAVREAVGRLVRDLKQVEQLFEAPAAGPHVQAT